MRTTLDLVWAPKLCRIVLQGTLAVSLLTVPYRPATSQEAPSVPLLTEQFGEPLPSGAVARLGSTRWRHGSQFWIGLSFADDDTTLIGVGEEHIICFWDATTGRLRKKISTEPLNVRGFATSRDGRQIAVAGFCYDDAQNRHESEVWIIDAASEVKVQTIKRADRSMDRHEMAFTPDGKSLIAIGTEGHIYVDDVASGKEILRQTVPKDNSPSLRLSPDGNTLAIASGPNTGKFFLWKWQSGEEPRELKIVGTRSRRYTGHFAFSPDSKRVAVCLDSGGDFPIQIWDALTGELVHRLNIPTEDSYLRGTLLFPPGGQSLLVPGWRRDRSQSVGIHSFDSMSGKYQGEMNVAAGGILAMSSDGRLLASTSGTGVRVWKWPTREEIMPNHETHSGSISRIETTSNGKIVTASDDGTIRVWDSSTFRQAHVFRHDNWIRDIAVSPDGLWLASSSLDDTVRLWNLVNGNEVYRLPGHGKLGGVRAVGFASDSKSFVSFGDDFYMRRWDVSTGKALAEYKLKPSGMTVPEDNDDRDPFDSIHQMSRAVVSPNGLHLATAGQKFFLFDAKSGRELHQLENPGSHIMAMVFSPDGRRLLASSWGKPVETKLADGRTRYSTEKNNPITLWDTASGQVVQQIVLADGGVGPVAFDRDGRRFAHAAARPNDSVSIFDASTGKKLQTIEGLPCRASEIAFTYDGKCVIAGLTDGTAVIWPIAEHF